MDNMSINNAADQISQLQGVAQANNAWSAEQAQIQRDWQVQQNAKAMVFNRNEAAKNRNWQEMMSNTAHQREVKDLMAAGLNPVLSAMNGNGAAVGSGATASGVTSAGAKGDTDESSSMAIVNLLGSILAANTQIEAANVNARTQEAVADKYTAMEHIVAQISAASGQAIAGINAASAGNVASINTQSAERQLATKNEQEKYMAQNYPTTKYQAASAAAKTPLWKSIVNNLKSAFSSSGSSKTSAKSASTGNVVTDWRYRN